MTQVAVTGAAGRMGKTLVQAIQDADDLTLGAAFEHPDSPNIGDDAGDLAGVGSLGVLVQSDPSAAVADFDVVIDFTMPSATLALADVCQAAGKAHPDSRKLNLRTCMHTRRIFRSSWHRT